ncbi:MAG: O-antigen ligase family protein [Crocinitomicaceae bacterium]
MLSKLTLTNIEYWAFCLLMVAFFAPGNTIGFVLVTIVIITIIKFVKKKHLFRGYGGLILFPILLCSLLLGMIYTSNTRDGWSIIERHYGLIGIPILMISIQQFSKQQRKNLLSVFIATGVVTGLICIGAATWHYISTGTVYTATQKGHFVYNNFMHHRLSSPIQLHAIYYSLYLAFAAIVVLNRFLYEKLTLGSKLMYVSVFAFFCVLILLLKSSIFALFFPLSCLLLLFFRFRKQLFSSLRAKIALVVILVGTSIFSYKGVQSKLESFSLDYELSDEHLTPLNMRMAMWECSWDVIKDSPWIGNGTGDGDNDLIRRYEQLGFTIGAKDRYNAHNMYLQYWLTNGIFTSLIFIGILGLLFRRAIRNRNWVFLSFVLLFAAFSCTESTMLRQNGIVFFLVISSLFYWFPKLWDESQEA